MAELAPLSLPDAPAGRFPRPGPGQFADLSRLGDAPRLLIVIDTEEEFDWSRPLSRDNTAVTAIAGQARAQEVFARHGVVPTYVIDWPVATTDAAIAALKPFLDDGACVIGTHLHPWVNPPHEEPVSPVNSYPGNLAPRLEHAKLARLTAAIAANFGRPPVIYKAGRYGVGPSTPAALAALGYRIDVSVVPYTAFTADGGPDFSDLSDTPYWIDPGEGQPPLLEIPLSTGFAGRFAAAGPQVYPRLFEPAALRLHAPGVMARLRLLERIRLSPEGAEFAALRRLTRAMLAAGTRVFSLTYHSPSLVPGHTPYVRTGAEVQSFLSTIDRYLRWFLGDLGGRPSTPEELYRLFGGAAP